MYAEQDDQTHGLYYAQNSWYFAKAQWLQVFHKTWYLYAVPHFELYEASNKFCTVCTPFGNYRYCRMPMGINQAPDMAQEIMELLLQHLEDVDVYIDNVGVFSNDW